MRGIPAGLLVASLLAACASAPSIAGPSATSPQTLEPSAAEPSPTVAPAPSATPSPVPTPDPARVLTAVHFADASHGWLGLENGILGTSDRGATWQRQLASLPITRLWSVDASHAWALAQAWDHPNDDVIYRTTDGRHWSATPPTTPRIAELQLISPLVGWGVAVSRETDSAGYVTTAGTLLGTSDGAQTWRPLATRPIGAVCFADARNGWGADASHVLRTVDGGKTWIAVFDLPLPDPETWTPALSCDGMRSARIVMTGRGAALGHRPYVVYRTSDAGASWTLEFGEQYTLGQYLPPDLPSVGSYPPTVGALGGGLMWFVGCSPPAERQPLLVLDQRGAALTRAEIPAVGCAHGAQVLTLRSAVVIAVDYRDYADPSLHLIATDDAGGSWREIYPGSGRWTN